MERLVPLVWGAAGGSLAARRAARASAISNAILWSIKFGRRGIQCEKRAEASARAFPEKIGKRLAIP
jgi:hypothetical protein